MNFRTSEETTRIVFEQILAVKLPQPVASPKFLPRGIDGEIRGIAGYKYVLRCENPVPGYYVSSLITIRGTIFPYLYVGETGNLRKRMQHHAGRFSDYTRDYSSLALIWYYEFNVTLPEFEICNILFDEGALKCVTQVYREWFLSLPTICELKKNSRT